MTGRHHDREHNENPDGYDGTTPKGHDRFPQFFVFVRWKNSLWPFFGLPAQRVRRKPDGLPGQTLHARIA
jgi:hypothetical protein